MRITIVGGGLAGLTAAAYAARDGHQVTVFEKSHYIGGRARTQMVEGFHLNMGPHALYQGSVGLPVLQGLGAHMSGGAPIIKGYLVYGGRRVRINRPFGLGLLRVRSIMALSRLLWRMMRDDPSDYAGMTLADFLKDSPLAVQDAMKMLVRIATYTHAPEVLGMDAVMDQLQATIRGNVRYLDGGWQTLVDQLAQIAKDHGAMIETDAQVTALDGETLHLADGRRIDADAVILATSPEAVRRLMPDANLPDMPKVRASVFDVALSSLPNPAGHVCFGMDEPYYLSVHSGAAALAPSGGALIHVAKYLAPGESTADRSELEQFLEIAQPEWRSQVVTARFLPDMIVSHAIVTGYANRPAVRLSERVFIAGDWVGDEGQLADAALASARRAANLACAVQPSEHERHYA